MINTKRKDLHISDLDYKYHYLASASLPYTDLLYEQEFTVQHIHVTSQTKRIYSCILFKITVFFMHG